MQFNRAVPSRWKTRSIFVYIWVPSLELGLHTWCCLCWPTSVVPHPATWQPEFMFELIERIGNDSYRTNITKYRQTILNSFQRKFFKIFYDLKRLSNKLSTPIALMSVENQFRDDLNNMIFMNSRIKFISYWWHESVTVCYLMFL